MPHDRDAVPHLHDNSVPGRRAIETRHGPMENLARSRIEDGHGGELRVSERSLQQRRPGATEGVSPATLLVGQTRCQIGRALRSIALPESASVRGLYQGRASVGRPNPWRVGAPRHQRPSPGDVVVTRVRARLERAPRAQSRRGRGGHGWSHRPSWRRGPAHRRPDSRSGARTTRC
jgi:hypothetical protein